MTFRCPNCDEPVSDTKPLVNDPGSEIYLPCGCAVTRPRILRVRKYTALALAHRNASGELAHVRAIRSGSES